MLGELAGCGVDGRGPRDDAGEFCQPIVVLLIDFGGAGDEGKQRGGVEIARRHDERRQLIGKGFRMNRAGGKLRIGVPSGRMGGVAVADDRAADRFRRVAGKPRDDVRGEPGLRQDIPDRLTGAAGAGDGAYAGEVGQRFDEAADAMLIGPLACGNGVPKHWREHRLDGRQVAADPAIDQAGERRQFPLRQQRPNHFPIRGVPADQEDSLG